MQQSATKVPFLVFAPATGLCLFQLVAIALACHVGVTTAQSDPNFVLVIGTIGFLIGGLPHGAFDLHLAAKRARLGPSRLAAFTAIYIGIFGLMLLGWALAPAFILPVFLITAALHFAADWPETDEPLFKFALGLAPLCAIGVSNLHEVELIFAAMANPGLAVWATRIFILIAPVTLLVAALALVIIDKSHAGGRPAVFAAMLLSLFILPPMIGFVLYFCAFHTPRHLIEIRADLSHIGIGQMLLTAAGMTAAALIVGGVALPFFLSGGVLTASSGFQLLGALAMPHQTMPLILKRLT